MRGRSDRPTVLAVFAHPDDESLACGGTLARLADAGGRIIVLCASHGENGSVDEPALLCNETLASVRARELRAAAAVLGVEHVLIFDHPDGELRWAEIQALRAEIMMTIDRFRPDAVITFGEDGLYWHLDHVGVHERTTMAVQSLGSQAPPLYYVTMPRGTMTGVVETARRHSDAPPDSTLWGIEPTAFGEHARSPDFVVDVRPWAVRKLSAIRCHRSQIGSRHPLAWIGDDDARRWLGAEQFRRAPVPGLASPLLEGLGEPVAS
jgi:LmbE family N-acetylglucosaminyl deacetylase